MTSKNNQPSNIHRPSNINQPSNNTSNNEDNLESNTRAQQQTLVGADQNIVPATLTESEAQALIARWHQVKEQLQHAQSHPLAEDNAADNNDPDKIANEVILLAVSKTKPASMVATLALAGQQHFGENYLQEAIEKIADIGKRKLEASIVWHYIGHIQRNKTRDIAEHFDWVQTIERGIIAKRLNEQRPAELPPLNVLIQVNIDKEASKSGCMPEEVSNLVETIKGYERLLLRGLMIIPAIASSDAFNRTRELFEQISKAHPELKQWDTLSMGMSGDMEQAVLAGSTMVRVGTAIFGERH